MSYNLTVNQLNVLSSLVDGEKYGLEIINHIKKCGGIMHLGSLYNLLNSLEKNGFIKSYSKSGDESRNFNKRKYYKITAKGVHKIEQAKITLLNNWKLAY